MKLLSYYRARFQYPELRDYADMGLGIEARYLRCKAYWKRHLELSKQFQARNFSRCAGNGSIAILGAGRLLDVPVQALGNFKKIHVFDADPSVRAAWKKMRRSLNPQQELIEHLEDATASILAWTKKLQDFLKQSKSKNLPALGEMLCSLQAGKPDIGQHEVIVSLNLLSQLGIYWRERVEKAVGAAWGVVSDEKGILPQPLEDAVAETQRRLEQGHLALLSASNAKLIVLLYDSCFLLYTKESSQWQEEPSLCVQDIALSGYSLVDQDTWLWHIAPQDIEQPLYGAIHQVQARCFRRS